MSELIEVKTIGEVEHIVHGSGLWDGTGPVEFSNDGESWREAWSPSEEHPYPEYARVSVYRKEVRIPTTVTIRWDEHVPRADEFWLSKWVQSPARHFGRTVRMIAFRQTFRELLGNLVLEDEAVERGVPEPTPVAAPAARDWADEIASAATLERLDVVEKDARAARIFTPDAAGTALHRALKDRRRVLVAASNVAAASGTDPVDVLDALDKVADAPTPDVDALQRPVRQPRQPQDYKAPANRAARRKSRKKGGRR